MSTVLWIGGALLGVAGLVGSVVYYLRRDASQGAALSERNAALDVERARVAQVEAAADEARRKRVAEFDAQTAAVHDADGAAELLRKATGADDPNTN